MADTERLMNKAQGDSIISALATIAANILQVPSEKLIIDWSYTTLPASGNDHTIYAIPTGDADDPWDFYVWNDVDEEWVQFDWNFAVDSVLSTTSENPVQNKVVTEALNSKVDAVTDKGLSTNDYTNEEKALVATIPNKADADDVEGTQTVSGNPITLTDAAPINAESLVVELEPVQDLHGYDNPWVGGAGKNKFDINGTVIVTNGINKTISGNALTLTTTEVNSAFRQAIISIDSSLTNLLLSKEVTLSVKTVTTSSTSDLDWRLYIFYYSQSSPSTITNIFRVDKTHYSGGYYQNSGTTPSDDVSSFGLIIRVDQNKADAVGDYVIFDEVQLEIGDSATSFSTFENICPITGYTECEVDDVGKNLFDEIYPNIDNGIHYKAIKVGDGQFTLSTTTPLNTDNKTNLFFLAGNVSSGASTTDNGVSVNNSKTVTALNGYVTIGYRLQYGVNPENYKTILEKSQTPTTYSPYASTSATIQFGQTVYGAEVDFGEGGTSDNRNEVVFDGSSDESWVFNGRTSGVYSAFHIVTSDAISIANTDTVVRCKCDRLKPISASETGTSPNYTIAVISNNRIYVIMPDIGTNVSDFKTWLSNNPIQVVYEVETPTQLSTPPTPLKMLRGTNNLSADGVMQIGYQPDNVIGEVKGEIEQHLEMPYLKILDNNVETPVNNYRIYYHLIVGPYTFVNMAEMLQHRFIFVELIQNPSGTYNHNLLHSALIDPRTIDGFKYQMKATVNDNIWIESNLDENKFYLALGTTGGSYSDGDPTDYYVTIRMVD